MKIGNAVQWGRWSSGGDGAVELPIAAAPPLDRTRDRGGVVTVAVNLILCVLAPTSYLWRCRTWAHQPCHIGLDAPDQGVDQGPSRPLGQLGGDQPNSLRHVSNWLCSIDHA
jgi:hypothetical protein